MQAATCSSNLDSRQAAHRDHSLWAVVTRLAVKAVLWLSEWVWVPAAPRAVFRFMQATWAAMVQTAGARCYALVVPLQQVGPSRCLAVSAVTSRWWAARRHVAQVARSVLARPSVPVWV